MFGNKFIFEIKYPCGFNINLLINSKIFNEKNKIQFFKEILKYEPKAEIKVASKGLLSITIQSNNENINDIFKYIEESKSSLGIEDYTIRSTSLEDVFLKINNKTILTDENILDNNFLEIKNELNTAPKTSSFRRSYL